MGKVIKSKRGLELVTIRSSGYEHVQKKSSVRFILSDQI